MSIASFDLDGVVFMGKYPGVYPGPNDVLITGRSWEERAETMIMLKEKGITQLPYFNPVKFIDKTRINSGTHKGNTIKRLNSMGRGIVICYEDDNAQAEEIEKIVPEVKIVFLQHNLTEKENVRHL